MSAAHPLPSLSLHRHRNNQNQANNKKKTYKIELLQATVDSQPLAQPYNTVAPDSVIILNARVSAAHPLHSLHRPRNKQIK
jgi:hypothetical protein